MPETGVTKTPSGEVPKPKDEAAKIALRQAVSDAYTFALSQELNEGIAAMNLENMMQQELTRLRGPKDSNIYLPVIERLKALKSTVEQSLDDVKDVPPERFAANVDQTGTNQDAEPG
jgi:hypothetical protein